ncbi:MAG: hypothetical protein Q9221_002129 [Calogaya cf. arnoldii]
MHAIQRDRIPNQPCQECAKLFQVDCSPSAKLVNDKRKETEKEIIARKLRKLESEITSLRGVVSGKKGLVMKRRQVERIKNKDGFEEKAAQAEATAGAKEKLPAMKKDHVYIQGPIADKKA